MFKRYIDRVGKLEFSMTVVTIFTLLSAIVLTLSSGDIATSIILIVVLIILFIGFMKEFTHAKK